MHKSLYCLAAAIWVTLAVSCGTSSKTVENDFYNKRNELSVTSKDGLFSSRHISFGSYTSGEKENGVDKHIINFPAQRAPFHFSFNDADGNTTSVQAVYTDRASLKGKYLPGVLDSMGTGEIFYAWVRGGTVNALKNWELMVRNPTYQNLVNDDEVGEFHSLTENISVHAHDRFGSSNSFTNMCFEFRLRGVPIGAVTVNGKKNRVWIDRQLDAETRFALAGAIAALIMR